VNGIAFDRPIRANEAEGLLELLVDRRAHLSGLDDRANLARWTGVVRDRISHGAKRPRHRDCDHGTKNDEAFGRPPIGSDALGLARSRAGSKGPSLSVEVLLRPIWAQFPWGRAHAKGDHSCATDEQAANELDWKAHCCVSRLNDEIGKKKARRSPSFCPSRSKKAKGPFGTHLNRNARRQGPHLRGRFFAGFCWEGLGWGGDPRRGQGFYCGQRGKKGPPGGIWLLGPGPFFY